MTWPVHGANPQYLYKDMGIEQPDNLIDFSVNTNPYSTSFFGNDYEQLMKAAIRDYPDPNSSRLVNSLSVEENSSQEQILVGNGGSECIFLLANHFRERNICIVEPTFGEYRKACSAYQCNIESFILKEETNWELDVELIHSYIKRNDVIFICHPNNPTGTTHSIETLVTIIKEAQKMNTYCVIDEAFYDFCVEPIQLSSYLQGYSNLIILRSMTKMFGIPGARLGYILANPTLINKLKCLQPPWSVNGIAQVFGELAIEKTQFVTETKSNVQRERDWLLPQLRALGFYVSNSKVNFFILREKDELRDMKDLIEFMLENAIVPRHTYNFIGLNGNYIRLAIKSHEENTKLVDILTRWKEQC